MAHPSEDRSGAPRAKRIGDTDAAFRRLGLLGRHESFVACLDLTRRLARYDAAVLIQGETGTGKELIARALHYLGPRRDEPFVPLNCGAVPDALFESELFGHEKGAFTDASARQEGLVHVARGGTLFLDEVDSLSPKAQIALLRFLQDRRYRAVGGRELKDACVHIVSACNADLTRRVAEGAFRSDLLYRINVAQIELPALRDRRSDIPILAQHFVDRFNALYCEHDRILDAAASDWLSAQPWPGNIRELENAVHRAWLLAQDAVLQFGSQANRPRTARFSGTFASAKDNAVRRFERDYLHQLMREHDGNVTNAARACGKERRALGRLLKKHGIDAAAYRERSG